MSTKANDALQERLVSWKRIANYLDCSERTARRWRNAEGLPIHNATGGASGTVFAFKSELDAWLKSRPADKSAAPPQAASAPRQNRAWLVVMVAGALLAAVALSTWSNTRSNRAANTIDPDRIALGAFVVDPAREDAPVLREMLKSKFSVTFARNGLDVVSENSGSSAPAAFELSGALDDAPSGSTISLSLVHQTSGGLLWAKSLGAADEGATAHAGATYAASVLRCLLNFHSAVPEFSAETLRHIARFCDATLDDEAGINIVAFAERIRESAPDNPSANAIFAGTLAITQMSWENWFSKEPLSAAQSRDRKIIAHALSNDPKNRLARSALVLIDAAAARKDLAQAMTILENALGDGISDFYLPHIHGRLLYLAGRHDDAMQQYFIILATNPYDGALRANLAMVLAAQGNNEMAYNHFERAMRDQPARKFIPWVYLESALFYGDPDFAETLVNGVVGEAAELSDLQRSCFNAFLAVRKREGESRSAIKACSELEPWHQFRIFAALGEADRAFAVGQGYWDYAPNGVVYAMLPEFADMRRDQRFWAEAEKFGLIDYWRETRNYPDFCRQDDDLDCDAWITSPNAYQQKASLTP